MVALKNGAENPMSHWDWESATEAESEPETTEPGVVEENESADNETVVPNSRALVLPVIGNDMGNHFFVILDT